MIIVIIVLIMKMIVMLMNKDGNKKQYFWVKKHWMKVKAPCLSTLNLKQPNMETHAYT